MNLHSSEEQRTEQLEESLYDALVCIVDVTLALDHTKGVRTPEIAAWIELYSGKPHHWRSQLGKAAIRRIQTKRRKGN
jgi:hypothetical protein